MRVWTRDVSIALLAFASAMSLALAGAQAPGATPASSPTPAGSEWRVIDVRALDVDGDRLTLSPDGQWLAAIGPDSSPCFWDVETLTPSCADARMPLIRNECQPSMVWSPHSSAVAFSLDAVIRLYDSDIYVFDRESGALTNLTDDGYEGDILTAPGGIDIDLSPAWSPDGQQIAFARTVHGGAFSPTAILRGDRAGGEPVNVVTMSLNDPWLVWLPMYWLPDDTIVYSRTAVDPEDPDNGIWRVGPDGATPEMLVPGALGADIPSGAVADLGPASGTMSIYSPTRLQAAQGYEDPIFWFGDLADGSVTMLPLFDLDAGTPLPSPLGLNESTRGSLAFPNSPAALSPDGTTAFVSYRSSGGDSYLATIDVATGEITKLDAGIEVRPVVAQWAGNDTVLAQGSGGPMLITLARQAG